MKSLARWFHWQADYLHSRNFEFNNIHICVIILFNTNRHWLVEICCELIELNRLLMETEFKTASIRTNWSPFMHAFCLNSRSLSACLEIYNSLNMLANDSRNHQEMLPVSQKGNRSYNDQGRFPQSVANPGLVAGTYPGRQ